MKCPKCGSLDDKVLDSRSSREGAAVRRRRECLSCGFRFTTYEEINRDELQVIKRDGSRQVFIRTKLEQGIRAACRKRPVTNDQISEIVDQVVASIIGEEITTEQIGELVMKILHDIDEVAYIRFASVYRGFTDVNQFVSIISDMRHD